jgi:hypothetical protein
MDMNRLITMVVRIFTAKLINIGLRKGIDLATRQRNSGTDQPTDAAQQAEAQKAAKRARQTARLNRRIGR